MEKIMAACATVPQCIPQSSLNATSEFEGEPWEDTTSDDALVESVKKGETDAFARLMDRYRGLCLSRAYLILRDFGDAEDEVQNTWLQAWTHLGSYRVRGAFSAWLIRILVNQCLMRLRAKKRTPTISIDQVSDNEGSFRLDLIDQRDLPEDMVGGYEILRTLTREISRIPPVLREVLIRRDVDDVAMEEVAGQLGIGVPAAKSRLMRGRIELRRRFTKHHGRRGGATLTRKAVRNQIAYTRAG